MQLDTIETETGPNPTATIIFLHGLGDSGNGFAPFAHELDLAAAGPLRFIFPHAPTRPVTVNGGYVMRAWYDILAADLVRREDEAGLRESQALVEALIAREQQRGIPASRIVLGGFSQGCAMTLLTGLRHRERLAGLVGLSGYLPLAAQTAAERDAANHGLPIFLAHGRQDPVVPIARALASRDALLAFGHPVEWHEYPMPHSVSGPEIADLTRWLTALLGPRSGRGE
ncbi:dienelactone hydrolase family protein [Rhizobacter sp. SG703]|uniref:alpha/beta hydrolase n=1 Tax=Rhizobacter sp. SG703 TaxID=2587140 RepID=UPI00144597FD|nr:dienelactone hydrolase family protein [Rhizobacter sp. SG703]NKI96434.1 phospholipase/carboxylesterase [Rhizobacter sp. SG703]